MIADFESMGGFFQVLSFEELHVNEVVFLTKHLGNSLKALDENANELLIREVIQVGYFTIQSKLILAHCKYLVFKS